MLGTSRDVKGGVEVLIEGSLEVKLPTIGTDEKQRWSRRIEKRRAEERRSEKRKSQKKEDVGARKGRKVAKHCVFPMFWGSGGSKSRFAKAAGAEPSGQMRDDKLHAVAARSTFQSQNAQKHQVRTTFGSCDVEKVHTLLWREAHFEVKMYKAPDFRTTFGSWDVEKVHTVVARSTFRSQNVQNTPDFRTTFGSWDVEKVHAVVARSTFQSQNVQGTPAPDHFWKLRCRKSAHRCGEKHISKSKC